MIKRFVCCLGALVLAFFLLAGTLSAQQPPVKTPDSRTLDPKDLDKAVSPTQDFYKFAEGGWLAANPCPPEFSRWGSFNELIDKNWQNLHAMLEEIQVSGNPTHNATVQRVSDFYASAMDSGAAERDGAKPMAPEFERIAALSSTADLPGELAHLHVSVANPVFRFYVQQDAKNSTSVIAQISQGGLGLPDRDYYTKDDERSKEIRKEYLAHVQKMFELLGDNAQAAGANAKTVMDFETRLAKASMTRVQRRDPEATYHRMSIGDLSDLTPAFAWKAYFAGIGKESPGPINVNQPDFFKEVNAMVSEVSLADWKTYLRWHVLRDNASWLSSPFVNENFHFNGGVLSGTKENQPRWKRAIELADRKIGEALGLLYVKKFFPPQAKVRVMEMVENLRAAFRERIKTRDWMGDETKAKALDKLDHFSVKIGYPDKWRDYSSLSTDRGPITGNIMRADEFEFKRNLDQIGKPVDRTEWGITPPTVNAYYNPLLNEIVFPAGILQPPFFDPNADDAVNYGGMGAVIGHEMTHGFDDQGSQYDADGNLKDWWTPVDKIAFKSRAGLLEKQYSEQVVYDTMHANGKLTLGENIADLGGLTIAYAAFKKSQEGKPAVGLIDGFSPDQRFFLGWAQIWRSNYREEELHRRLMTDSHSISSLRVNCPLADMTEFQAAFGAKDSDPMVRPMKVRARIW